MDNYSDNFNGDLNHNASLLAERERLMLNTAFDFTQLTADQIRSGVYAALDKTTGIQYVVDKTDNIASIQSRNYDATSTGFQINSDGSIIGFSFRLVGGTLQMVQQYTAGENLTAGKLVCMKNTEETWGADSGATHNTSTIIAHDTYADQANPDTNRNEEMLIVGETSGTNSRYGYIWVNTSESGIDDWFDVDKVTLHLRLIFNNLTGPVTLNFYLVTATWDESTLTWNNKPTNGTYVWKSQAFTASSATGYYTFDITDLYRLWKRDAGGGTGLSNFGLVIKPSVSNIGTLTFGDSERVGGGSFNQKPYITITSNKQSDGKAYLASDSDYNKVKTILGIAEDTVSSAATVNVRMPVDGSFYSGTYTAGKNYYLTDTSGTIDDLIAHVDTLKWQRKVGIGAGTKLIFQRDTSPKFISDITYDDISNTRTFLVIPPVQCTKIVLTYYLTGAGAGSISTYGTMTLFRDRANNISIQDTGDDNPDSYYAGITALWQPTSAGAGVKGNLNLTFFSDNNTFGAGSTCTIYFYE